MGKHKKYNTDDMIALAKTRGGECLSEFVSTKQNIKWKCKNNHIWEANSRSIINGYWCRECSGYAKGSIEKMKELANKKGWTLLSNEYINSQTRLLWECGNGHLFEMIPANVARGYNCKECNGDVNTIDKINNIAISRGGKCISVKFLSNQDKLMFECDLGHEFSMSSNSVTRGQWCPVCATFRKEKMTRLYMENIFLKPFPKIKPNWLVNSNGNRMEIDGFCNELNVGFEYHGIQHYKIVKKFIDNDAALDNRKKDDLIKEELCREHGVKLIILNYQIVDKEIPNAIFIECHRLGIDTSGLNFNVKIDTKLLYSKNLFIAANKIAESKNGKCLIKGISNSHEMIKWQCHLGHQWIAPLSRIRQGHWCPKCAKNEKYAYDFVCHKIEEEGNNEYKVLDKKYEGADKKLKLLHNKCNKIWISSFSKWNSGYRCPICQRKKATKKLTFSYEQVKKIIESSGDYLLIGKEYINANKKIAIKHLNCNTVFDTTLGRWRSGKRCRICSYKNRKKKNMMTYGEAKEYIRKMNIKSYREWRDFCKRGDRPNNLPSAPDQTYQKIGWTNWREWFST